MHKFFGPNADFIGFLTSFACAIHCTAIPIMFSLGLIKVDALDHNHWVDVALVCTGFIVASYALIRDFLKRGRWLPVIMGAIGISFLIVGLTGHDMLQNLASIIGGTTLASAHFINWRTGHRNCKVY